jgi:hypothetical protein
LEIREAQQRAWANKIAKNARRQYRRDSTGVTVNSASG